MNNKSLLYLTIACFVFFSLLEQGNSKTYERALEEVTATDALSSNSTSTSTGTKTNTNAAPDISAMMRKNILVWTPILLVAILAYVIFLISTMENPKNTLLYATYVTSKSEKYN